MRDTALLIIDMQTGNFLGSSPIYNGTELLTRVSSLLKKARMAQVVIVYVQNKGCQGDPDEVGTTGWTIHASIPPRTEDVVIHKSTPDAFHETPLQDELAARRIKHLVVAGLQTEYCIDTTCRRAFSLGYHITLVKDAHSTWDSLQLTAQQIINHHNHVLGGWFTTTKKEREVAF
jgi:nicotinamidase-related amidase